jgi:hypothetical protein
MAKYDLAAGLLQQVVSKPGRRTGSASLPTGLRVDLPSDPGKMALLVGTSSFSVSVISESVNRDFVSGYECGEATESQTLLLKHR